MNKGKFFEQTQKLYERETKEEERATERERERE